MEKLEPTIGLEPMTCRLQTDEDADPDVTQPTSVDVTRPLSTEHPETKILPASPSSSG
jgi:hypothetical protein